MSTECKITSIQFKRGVKSILDARLIASDLGIPIAGEPIWESDTNKLKIGDGVTPYASLPYLSGGSSSESPIVRGYYFNGKFYTSSTYQTEITPSIDKFYVDLNSGSLGLLYVYDDTNTRYISTNDNLPTATDVTAGTVKLYQVAGHATDGTMSQKVVTEGVQAIKFNVETAADEDGDGVDENILVLELPWNNI